MNITPDQLSASVTALCRLGARRVLLFGSYAIHPDRAGDVDLAVEGIPLHKLLEADAMVSDLLGVPVDLVSREESPRFYDLIARDARVLHDEPTASRTN